MAKAGVILDLPGDKAKVLGTWVDLEVTSGGHYAMCIMPVEKDLTKVERCLAKLPNATKEKEGAMLKLHRQFGHPRKELWETLLKKVKIWNKTMMNMVGKIHARCRVCKLKKDEYDKSMTQEEENGGQMHCGRKGPEAEKQKGEGIELRRLDQKQVQEEEETQPKRQQEEQDPQQQEQLAITPEQIDNQELVENQEARVPQQQRQQAQRSVTAPADTRATGRKQTMYPKAGDHIQYREGDDWYSAEVMGRGGKASSKLHFDYFNLRSRGKEEEEKQCGVHLDRTEWRFDDEAKNLQDWDEKEEDVVEEALITGRLNSIGHHPLTGIPMLLPTFDTI